MRLGSFPPWTGWLIGAAFWAAMGFVWMNSPGQDEWVVWACFTGAALALARGIYSIISRSNDAQRP